MNFHYDEWLITKLSQIQELLNVSNFSFSVVEEQDFIMPEKTDPNKVYIVVKRLSNTMSYNYTIQPLQLMILCENNSLEKSLYVFKTLAKECNFVPEIIGDLWIKPSYTEPVVLNNFNEVLYGYRSVMYMTVTLNMMDGIGDLTDISINGEKLKVLGTSIGYSMSPDTQQMNKANTKNFIASSVKSASSLSITFSIPLLNKTFVKDVLNIINEKVIEADPLNNISRYEYNGNNDFVVTFSVLGIDFTQTMKLSSASVRSTPNEIPMLEVGLIK